MDTTTLLNCSLISSSGFFCRKVHLNIHVVLSESHEGELIILSYPAYKSKQRGYLWIAYLLEALQTPMAICSVKDIVTRFKLQLMIWWAPALP